MNEGWIRLWRKLLKSVIFDDEGLLKFWIWCLLKASFREEWVSVRTGRGQTQVKLLPGQFVFQRNTAAKELKMNPATAAYRLATLTKLENLSIQSGTHFSICSIINWPTYQIGREELCQALYHPTGTQPAPKVCEAAEDQGSEALKKLKSKEYISCGTLEALRAHLASTGEFSDLPESTQDLIVSFLDKARASNKTGIISSRRAQTIMTDLIAIAGDTSMECLEYALGATITKAKNGEFTFCKHNVTGYARVVARNHHERSKPGNARRYELHETDVEALYR